MKLRIRDGSDGATAFLKSKGAPISDDTLRDLAYFGHGPKYSLLNGRAVYTDEDLLAWLKEEINKPVPRRCRASAQQAVQS